MTSDWQKSPDRRSDMEEGQTEEIRWFLKLAEVLFSNRRSMFDAIAYRDL